MLFRSLVEPPPMYLSEPARLEVVLSEYVIYSIRYTSISRGEGLVKSTETITVQSPDMLLCMMVTSDIDASTVTMVSDILEFGLEASLPVGAFDTVLFCLFSFD